MATHGNARKRYEAALSAHLPFKEGAAISAINGKHYGTGRLPNDWAGKYAFDDVAYTVLSYGTPIAWITTGGEKVIPDVSYSVTTTHHQTLVKVNL